MLLQHGLDSLQCLELYLLVSTEHDRGSRWIQVQAYSVLHLIHKVGIVGDLETAWATSPRGKGLTARRPKRRREASGWVVASASLSSDETFTRSASIVLLMLRPSLLPPSNRPSRPTTDRERLRSVSMASYPSEAVEKALPEQRPLPVRPQTDRQASVSTASSGAAESLAKPHSAIRI